MNIKHYFLNELKTRQHGSKLFHKECLKCIYCTNKNTTLSIEQNI